jgi:putative transposase
MARPTRIDLQGGWYHVTARGNERRAIYRDDRDRSRFLELLEELVGRFGVGLHAYVLMDNHYHLVVETPRANLSEAMQWLGVSYSGWFNRRHGRAGHLFQGRFKGIVLEGVGVAATVADYVHLNPVRVKRLGLDKAAQRRWRSGMGEASAGTVVAERLRRLRQYRWSSYRAYVGWADCPYWLTRERILEALGGGRLGQRERMGKYRRQAEQMVREGREESPWERLEAGLVLGGKQFVRQMRRRLEGNVKEQPALRQMQARPRIDAVVAAVEREKGQRWREFRDRHGDWGRDLVLYLGRRGCGLKLRELAELAGGVDDATVGMAVKRFQLRLGQEPQLRRRVKQIEAQMLNVGM